jgi:hypothetical protein
VSEHLSQDAIAMLALSPRSSAPEPERAAFEAHAVGCETCRAEWTRAVRLAELMGTLATPPPPSEKSLARTRARVRALLASEPRPEVVATDPRRAGITVAAALLVSVVLGFAMTGPPISIARAIIALATIGVATLLPSIALRSEREALGATGLALSLSVALAWIDYNEWPLVPGHTIGCMQIELAIGALPLMAMLGFSRGTGARLGSFASAAAGACGALAGQGVLLTSCAADESVLHVLFFHVAGVAVATVAGAGLGTILGRLRPS